MVILFYDISTIQKPKLYYDNYCNSLVHAH